MNVLYAHGARPSTDAWLIEAKSEPDAGKIGMYLTHNGVVRATAKALVREGAQDTKAVTGLVLTADESKAKTAMEDCAKLPGIYCLRVWIAEGRLAVGDDMMLVLVGGDTRPHTVDALQYLVGRIKSECVTETELYD